MSILDRWIVMGTRIYYVERRVADLYWYRHEDGQTQTVPVGSVDAHTTKESAWQALERGLRAEIYRVRRELDLLKVACAQQFGTVPVVQEVPHA